MPEFVIDFTRKSPRAYRGKASEWDGHNGARTKAGTWAPNKISRKRWTTALVEPALDQLHELATELGMNRCEVVERLLLDPAAVASLKATVTAERAAAEAKAKEKGAD